MLLLNHTAGPCPHQTLMPNKASVQQATVQPLPPQDPRPTLHTPMWSLQTPGLGWGTGIPPQHTTRAVGFPALRGEGVTGTWCAQFRILQPLQHLPAFPQRLRGSWLLDGYEMWHRHPIGRTGWKPWAWAGVAGACLCPLPPSISFGWGTALPTRPAGWVDAAAIPGLVDVPVPISSHGSCFKVGIRSNECLPQDIRWSCLERATFPTKAGSW